MQASLSAKSFWTRFVRDYICLSQGQKGIWKSWHFEKSTCWIWVS